MSSKLVAKQPVETALYQEIVLCIPETPIEPPRDVCKLVNVPLVPTACANLLKSTFNDRHKIFQGSCALSGFSMLDTSVSKEEAGHSIRLSINTTTQLCRKTCKALQSMNIMTVYESSQTHEAQFSSVSLFC